MGCTIPLKSLFFVRPSLSMMTRDIALVKEVLVRPAVAADVYLCLKSLPQVRQRRVAWILVEGFVSVCLRIFSFVFFTRSSSNVSRDIVDGAASC